MAFWRRSSGSMPWISRPYSVFSHTVRCGYRAKFWKTMPSLRWRSFRSPSGGRVVTSSSSMSTRPDVGSMSRLRQRTRVDLPLPDRPMTTTISPSSTSKLALFTPTPSPVFFRISSLDLPSLRSGRAFSGCAPKTLKRFSTTIFAMCSPYVRRCWTAGPAFF